MNTTFSERLKSVVAKLDGSDRSTSAFARRVDMSEGAIRQYLSGKSLPRIDVAAQIASKTGVSITWLATGHGPRDASAESLQPATGTQPEHEGSLMLQPVDPDALAERSLVLVPRLDIEASAGSGTMVEHEEIAELVAFDERWLRSMHISPRFARVITARGDSMEPTIRSGDLLIVDTAIEMAVDSGVYVLVYDGVLLVKRLFMLRNGSLLVSSDNKIAGREEEISADQVPAVQIAGRVMWYGRAM